MVEAGGMSDEQLLADAWRGDEAAFELLVERHRKELYAHCYRMLGSLQDAEDAVQESLLGAWRGLAGFDGRSSPATSPVAKDAIDVSFQTLNRYLGVAVGEHLGYLFTGAWTALVGVALIQSDVLHPLFGVIGLVLSPLFLLGSMEFVGSFERAGWRLAGVLIPVAYSGWSIWLMVIGIGLLITA